MKRQSFAQQSMTQQQARAQLALDLSRLPDDRLFAITPLILHARYRLPLREIEAVLLAKQDTRRRFLASGEITCA